MIGKVALEGLTFHAYHGVYPHERETGNWFEVDITVETDFAAAAAQDELEGTINYESLFQLVKHEMEQPAKLLETIVGKIANDVLLKWPAVGAVEIKIAKLNPPIGGKCKKAFVSLSLKR